MRAWPHAPTRDIKGPGTYIVTGATSHKAPLFRYSEDLDFLHDLLLSEAEERQWQLHAWAVFANHYHFVGTSPDGKDPVALVKRFHSLAGIELNKRRRMPGRKVLASHWQTELTDPKDIPAHLNFVHQNPVRHRIVRVARDYRCCSAAWFEDGAERSWLDTVSRASMSQVNVLDQF